MNEDTTARRTALEQALKDFTAEVMKHTAGGMLRLMQQADISMPQLVTVMFLHRGGRSSISTISEHLNLSLGATSHLIDRLVKINFVTRTEDPNDRRLKQVALTDIGLAFVEEVKQARIDEVVHRFDHLPPALQDDFTTVMAGIAAYLRDHDSATRRPTD